MSSSLQQAYEPNTILKGEAPSSLAGNSATYQSGGQGVGFDGKEIRPGVMEFSTYKSGGSRKRRARKQSQRKQQQRKQRKSKRNRSSRRR
jgi:hypothetical protein